MTLIADKDQTEEGEYILIFNVIGTQKAGASATLLTEEVYVYIEQLYSDSFDEDRLSELAGLTSEFDEDAYGDYLEELSDYFSSEEFAELGIDGIDDLDSI